MALVEIACICVLGLRAEKGAKRERKLSYDSKLGHSPTVPKLATSVSVLKTQTDTSVHINAEVG